MEVGLSTCSKVINENLFSEYAKNNIKYMEISVAHDEYKNLDYEFIRKTAIKNGICLWSFHLPFSPFTEIDISKKRIRKMTIEYYKDLITKASSIGIKNFIVHPSGEPILNRFRNNRIEYAKESLYEIAEFASDFGCTVLCENLPRTCLGKDSSEILELISVSEKLGVCFDTNHLLKESTVDFIKKVGDRIKSVHISDYDRINERHWLPGEGCVNWTELHKALINTGYNGPWLYEIGFSASSSVNRNRKLTCADFRQNADEIFNGKSITLIK